MLQDALQGDSATAALNLRCHPEMLLREICFSGMQHGRQKADLSQKRFGMKMRE
jgi:hypothetical protein